MSFTSSLLEQTPAYLHWKKIGIGPHHGINLPLFALRTQQSSGIGEFPDLIPLIHWCSSLGLDVIQLLPLNDTGRETSPYSALSAYALNPLHLGLSSLSDVNASPSLLEKLHQLKRFNETKRISYRQLFQERELFLKEYFALFFDSIAKTKDYLLFIQNNTWLEPYALYKALKAFYEWQSFQHWPSSLKTPTHLEIQYHIFVQYLCFNQLKEVKQKAEENAVFLKGDIPILINRDSADVFTLRHLFNLNASAGAPPDMYALEGQNWGFPLYNWEEMEKAQFLWWKERLSFAQQFYHLYRIDHAVGFFRIWGIPLGQTAKTGHFFPKEEALWIPQGEKILKQMLGASLMLPIAEDLGSIPDNVRASLSALGIPGTKVMRWERFWHQDQRFIPKEHYSPCSLTCVSTHDSETLPLWWYHHPEDARAFCALKGWKFTYEPTRQQIKEILYDSHHSGSLFHINLLQEYLYLIPGLTWPDLKDERINVPGTLTSTNWSYRFRPCLEEILENKALYATIKELIS